MHTRRQMLAVTGAAMLARGAESRVKGVMIGAQSYSFRELPDRKIDTVVNAYRECGLTWCELWQNHIDPSAREKLDAAGIHLHAISYAFRSNFTDEQIEAGFKAARSLGVDRITSSANVSVAKRLDPFARSYKIKVGMHNHSRLNRDEFARPEDFAEAMKGTSEYIGINLDIGHFTAAGYDPVSYLQQHHDRIVTIHIKDRKKDQGDNVEFGEGDTDIKGVLGLLKVKTYPIPAMIEYEYSGPAGPIAEVKKCYAYMRGALEA